MSDPFVSTEVVQLGERTVTVRELTLAEIRAWLAAADRPLGNVVDRLLVPRWNLQDIPQFCDATPDDLDAVGPSRLRELIGTIERINVDFFAMCEQLKALLAAPGPLAPTSSAPSPD